MQKKPVFRHDRTCWLKIRCNDHNNKGRLHYCLILCNFIFCLFAFTIEAEDFAQDDNVFSDLLKDVWELWTCCMHILHCPALMQRLLVHVLLYFHALEPEVFMLSARLKMQLKDKVCIRACFKGLHFMTKMVPIVTCIVLLSQNVKIDDLKMTGNKSNCIICLRDNDNRNFVIYSH